MGRGSAADRNLDGNAVEIVGSGDVQFTKTPEILAAMVPEGIEKSGAALEELARKGLGGDA